MVKLNEFDLIWFSLEISIKRQQWLCFTLLFLILLELFYFPWFIISNCLGRIKSECGEILQPVKLHSTLHNRNTGFTPGSNSGPKPESGRYLHVEPEKVLQSSPESGPTRRNELKKRKLDESTPRIDMFLQTSVKKRKEEPALKPKTRVVSVPFKLSICRRRKEEETMKSGLIGTITTDKGVSTFWFHKTFSSRKI